jgi:hypothetical protein
MCVDECGVVWPYLLESGDTDGAVMSSKYVEALRLEFASVVAERHVIECYGHGRRIRYT